MAITKGHELHRRRFSRNIGVGLTLLAFVAVVFGLTMAKINNGGTLQGADHVLRPELVPQESGQ